MDETSIKLAIRKATMVPLAVMILLVGALDYIHRHFFNEPGVPAIIVFVFAVATSIFIFEKALLRLTSKTTEST